MNSKTIIIAAIAVILLVLGGIVFTQGSGHTSENTTATDIPLKSADLKYFEIKYDDDNYSKAFKEYRKEWVQDHLFITVLVLVLLLMIPLSIDKYKDMQIEIATSDVFRFPDPEDNMTRAEIKEYHNGKIRYSRDVYGYRWCSFLLDIY